MCSDLMNLERDIKQLERNGVDYLHVDVMDAHFVPNLTFGVDFIAAMHRVTALPLDIHLMVEQPLPLLQAMDIRPGDRISLHVELGEQLHELAKAVRARGAHFGLVVNPSTPAEALAPYLDEIEWVVLMLVNPASPERNSSTAFSTKWLTPAAIWTRTAVPRWRSRSTVR